MKELSIEQKAKAYDEIIKKANKMYHENCEACQMCIEELIPELAENEDEGIRKLLLRFVKYDMSDNYSDDFNKEDCLAWLEKQGKENSKKVSIWKHWKDGIAGNGEGKPIYLIKYDYTYSLSSCLGFECDYIELSELDKLMLEKQGEQKPVNLVTILDDYFANTPKEQQDKDLEELKHLNNFGWELVEQNPADKLEPKFHDGEWITNGDYTWKIVEVKPLDYILQSQDGNVVDDTISHVDEQFHSFTIKDAKDGDILATSAGAFIYNGNNGGGSCPGSYCGIDNLGGFKTGVKHHWTGKLVFPATKEQRELLFQRMKEAGYEWSSEHRKLIKRE